jgi:hypothetical protein
MIMGSGALDELWRLDELVAQLDEAEVQRL